MPGSYDDLRKAVRTKGRQSVEDQALRRIIANRRKGVGGPKDPGFGMEDARRVLKGRVSRGRAVGGFRPGATPSPSRAPEREYELPALEGLGNIGGYAPIPRPSKGGGLGRGRVAGGSWRPPREYVEDYTEARLREEDVKARPRGSDREQTPPKRTASKTSRTKSGRTITTYRPEKPTGNPRATGTRSRAS